jgi:hypothetical protein
MNRLVSYGPPPFGEIVGIKNLILLLKEQLDEVVVD